MAKQTTVYAVFEEVRYHSGMRDTYLKGVVSSLKKALAEFDHAKLIYSIVLVKKDISENNCCFTKSVETEHCTRYYRVEVIKLNEIYI